jgi:hypothetical protein
MKFFFFTYGGSMEPTQYDTLYLSGLFQSVKHAQHHGPAPHRDQRFAADAGGLGHRISGLTVPGEYHRSKRCRQPTHKVIYS